jgi:hypothetical protein
MFNFGITFQSESSNSPVNRKAEKLEGEIGCLSSCRQQRKSPPTVKIASDGKNSRQSKNCPNTSSREVTIKNNNLPLNKSEELNLLVFNSSSESETSSGSSFLEPFLEDGFSFAVSFLGFFEEAP